MQRKNSPSPIQVHPMKLIRYLTKSTVQPPCQSVYGHTHTPMSLSVGYAIVIYLAMTRPPHFQLFLSLSPYLCYFFLRLSPHFLRINFHLFSTHIHSLSSSLFMFLFVSSIMPSDGGWTIGRKTRLTSLRTWSCNCRPSSISISAMSTQQPWRRR